MNERKANLLLVMVAAVWGGGFIATSAALEFFTPFYTMMIRFLVSGLLLGICSIKYIRNASKTDIRNGVIAGILLFLAFGFQTFGLQYSTPSKNAFLTATNVVFVPYLLWLLYKRKPQKKAVISSVICAIGVSLLTLNGTDFSFSIGDVLSIICALFFALHMIALEYFHKTNVFVLTSFQLGTAGVISTIFALVFEKRATYVSSEGWFSLLFLILFSTLFAYLIQTFAQKFTTANAVSLILSTEALFATWFSYLIFKEEITMKMLVGALLIFVAIIIAQKKKKEIRIEETCQPVDEVL